MSKQVEEVFIWRWDYIKPDFVPNENGNIVLIKKLSFGPLEVYEWGLDSDRNAYELYQWVENEFFEDTSYCITIEKEKLLEQIYSVISLFRDNGLPEWANYYERAIVYLNTEQMKAK